MAAMKTGSTAVITGAGSGIGLALAHALAARGTALMLADKDTAALDRACRALAHHPQTIVAMPTDVSEGAQIDALCARSFALLGRVDLVVNNAGILATGACWELDAATFERVLGVNLWSVIHSVRAFVPRMAAQGNGHIVNIASMAGLAVGPWLAPYTIAKQGVVALSEGLAMELAAAELPVKVSVACPGPVATGIAHGLHGGAGDGSGESGGLGAMNRALRAGIAQGMPADAVARIIVDAVEAGDFWILPHAQAAQAALARADRIAGGRAPAFSTEAV